MLFNEVIVHKRDGQELTDEEIRFFVEGLTDGSLPAEQASALAMAILLNGMNVRETSVLTTAMATSGSQVDWSDTLDGPVLDKHSTGGVGDKTSFMLAPVIAACGGFVPMISGRGLGHTGGTLDKLDSIPGYQSTPPLPVIRKVVKDVGCAIIGQTEDLAPADRTLYAIRDVTGTVESIPLITASILSKKIAAGNQGLVMDVKVGTGAFMKTLDDARTLAKSIVGTAAASGLRTHAVLTDMNEVLGKSAGNAVELVETIQYLDGTNRETRLDRVVTELASEMLLVAKLEHDRGAARERVQKTLDSGLALEVFAKMVAALGGPNDFVERYRDYLPQAPLTQAVYPKRAGFFESVDARQVGNSVVAMGGGRRTQGDTLNLSVGLTEVAAIGSPVDSEAPLCLVHAANESDAASAKEIIQGACRISDAPPPDRPIIIETLIEA